MDAAEAEPLGTRVLPGRSSRGGGSGGGGAGGVGGGGGGGGGLSALMGLPELGGIAGGAANGLPVGLGVLDGDIVDHVVINSTSGTAVSSDEPRIASPNQERLGYTHSVTYVPRKV